jgi:L-asparaginase
VAEAIPQLRKVARLEVEELMRVGSSAITVANWLALARRINEILEKENEVHGVVVTHGSNTVEETAYFLGLTVKSDKPVVLTAAQRQFTTLSSDSPRNFLQAVSVAASDAARAKGALVVVNDSIHAAREVTKEISYRLETYGSKDLGGRALRRARADRAAARGRDLHVRRRRRHADRRGGRPRQGARAGDRRVSHRLAQPGDGEKPREARRDYIWADNLSPQKARVLLMLALTRTQDRRELQRIFDEY